MRYRFFYPFALFLATVASASEFDLTRFPVANEAEARFKEAYLGRAANPAASLTVFRALEGDQRIPRDALLFVLAELSGGDERKEALRKIESMGPGGPFFAQAVGELAALDFLKGDFDGAAARYERLSKSESDAGARARALSPLLDSLAKAGKAEAARAVAVKLWTEYAHTPESANAGAYLAVAGGDPNSSLLPEELYERGKTLLDSGSREKAVETLLYLKKSGKKGGVPGTGVDLALGKALHYLRRYAESLEPLSNAAKNSRDADTVQSAAFWHARSLFGLDRGDEGAPELVNLARRYPAAKKAPMWLFQAYRVFEGRSMTKEAQAARSKLLEKYPNSEEAAELALSDAMSLYSAGRYKDAAKRFEASANRSSKGWLRSQGLYWAARSYAKAGEAASAARLIERISNEYPVGYYFRAASSIGKEGGDGLGVPDLRGHGMTRLNPKLPEGGDLARWSGAAGRAAGYLRLGMDEAARRILAREGGEGWLSYWAGDFKGSLKSASAEWHEWRSPSGGLDPRSLFYPLAYPSSVAAGAAESDVHPNLILAIAHTESHFDADAYSPWEARGLMQFIPDTGRRTARSLGIEKFKEEMLFDPPTALRLGARHLKELLDRFGGNVVSAVAAYNAGEAAVAKWREKWPQADEAEFVERIPYKETRRYVKKVITALDAYAKMTQSAQAGR